MITADEIQGHWRRAWLRAPGGDDTTTRVHWMQAGDVYADVRVPLDRPSMGGATCLAELPVSALAALAQAEGFAGTTSVTDSTCTWTRVINWHGATSSLDAGRLSWDREGCLVEEGVYATYAELWTRPADEPTRAEIFAAGSARAYLVTVGQAFVLGFGWLDAPLRAPVVAALADGHRHADVPALFEGAHALGHWSDAGAVADLATNPFMEGHPILTRTENGVALRIVTVEGATRIHQLAAVAPG